VAAERRDEPLLAGMWKEIRSGSWVPYALCFAVFLLFRFMVIGTLGAIPGHRVAPLDNVLAFVPWGVRARSALGVVWDYFGLLTVPLVLSADYSYNQVPVIDSWLALRCVAGILLLCAAAVGAVWARRPAVRFVVAFPFVALLLTANLLFPIGTVKAERLLYLPSVGWVFLAALGFERLRGAVRGRALCTAILGLVVVAFAIRTWLRNDDWKDNLSLFASTARSAPFSAKAQYNLGSALQEHGAHAAAIAQYERALAIASWTEGAALAIGIEEERMGRVDEAIARYRQALDIYSDYHEAHTNLCHVLLNNQRFAAATRACRSGLRYYPADANLLKGLGSSLMGVGDTEKATAVLRHSLALNPHDDALRRYLESLGTAMIVRDDARTGRSDNESVGNCAEHHA